MWAYTEFPFSTLQLHVTAHVYIYSSSTNTAWNFYIFLCLSACPSLRVPLNLHSIPPFHQLTSSKNAPTVTSGSVKSEGGIFVACNCAGKTAMDPRMPFQQTIKPYSASSSHEPEAAGSCCMLTTAIQLTGQLGKAVRAIINTKKLGRSDQIYWCIVQFNCSAYLKNSEDFGVDGSVMGKIYTTV